MRQHVAILFALSVLAIPAAAPAFAQQTTGTIRGRVRLAGELPGNPIIRMGADPMCAGINAGKRQVQEIVAADAKGDLANVFIHVEGNFPHTAVPTKPVVLNQQSCMYSPRVLGMRVGQTLQIHNEDPLSHNVHLVSQGANGYSVTMTTKGAVSTFKPKAEEVMLRVVCDFHRWMTAFIGVVNNPYFAVTGERGTFEIPNVPPGTYTVQAWQEAYGPVTKKVTVTAGGVTNLDFTYSGKEAVAHPGRL